MKKLLAIAALFLLAMALQAQTSTEFKEKAIKEINREKFDKAIEYLDKAIAIAPDSADYYYLRGCVNYALHDNKAGASDFETAVKTEPDNYRHYYSIAQFYYYNRMFYEAEDYYTGALKLSGLHDTIKYGLHLNRSGALHSVRDFDGAYKDLMVCYMLDSTKSSVQVNISNIFRDKGDMALAEKWLLKADKTEPNNVVINNNLGYFYIQERSYEKAVKYLDFVIAKADEHPNIMERKEIRGYAYSNRGFCNFKLGNIKKALADFEQGIKYCPENSYVYKNRALLYIDQKKLKEACGDLTIATALGFTEMYGDEVDKLSAKYCR
jgi:tetratricopeptide (TPR) repeat protein